MAHHDAWSNIAQHGLLSTEALIDKFEIIGAEKSALTEQRRAESVPIQHISFGTAIIRDNKPMYRVRALTMLDRRNDADGLVPKTEWTGLLLGPTRAPRPAARGEGLPGHATPRDRVRHGEASRRSRRKRVALTDQQRLDCLQPGSARVQQRSPASSNSRTSTGAASVEIDATQSLSSRSSTPCPTRSISSRPPRSFDPAAGQNRSTEPDPFTAPAVHSLGSESG